MYYSFMCVRIATYYSLLIFLINNTRLLYLLVWRYKSFNFFSIAHPVVFQMPLFMPYGHVPSSR